MGCGAFSSVGVDVDDGWESRMGAAAVRALRSGRAPHRRLSGSHRFVRRTRLRRGFLLYDFQVLWGESGRGGGFRLLGGNGLARCHGIARRR